jgi:hypothetical protein
MSRSLCAVVLSVLIAGFAAAGGCSADDRRTPTPSAAPEAAPPTASTAVDDPPGASAAAPPSVSAVVDDPPGAITCARVVRAVREATLMMPGVVADVVRASGTADAPVADAAQRLSAAYAAAVEARGTDSEPDAVAAVSAAAAEMVGVCGDSGLGTVG